MFAMALIAISADPALAHYVYEETNTYQTDSQCTTVWSEVSHGSGGGYAKARTESTQDLPIWGVDCRYDKAKPPGWITARWQYYIYATDGNWYLCAYYPGWAYNSTNRIDLVVASSFSSPPCGGPAYYATIAFGGVYDNGGWRPSNYASAQQGIWSGIHWLP